MGHKGHEHRLEVRSSALLSLLGWMGEKRWCGFIVWFRQNDIFYILLWFLLHVRLHQNSSKCVLSNTNTCSDKRSCEVLLCCARLCSRQMCPCTYEESVVKPERPPGRCSAKLGFVVYHVVVRHAGCCAICLKAIYPMLGRKRAHVSTYNLSSCFRKAAKAKASNMRRAVA